MKMTKNIFDLLAAGGMLLPVGNATAELSLQQRETVQDISWSVEILAFVAALVIALFIWRISKRDIKKRNSERDDS
jgi:membrane protein implicated in regulation of membrane protease activity